MKRILAILVVIVSTLFPTTSIAAELMHLYSDADYAYYGYVPYQVQDMGTWVRMDMLVEPLTQKRVQDFREASKGLEPGYIATTFAFDKTSPRMQATYMLFVGVDGQEHVYNRGLNQSKWNNIPESSSDARYIVWLGVMAALGGGLR